MPARNKRCLNILEQSTLAFLNFPQTEKIPECLIKCLALEFKIKKAFLFIPEQKIGNIQTFIMESTYGFPKESSKKDFALTLNEEACSFLSKNKNLVLPLSKPASLKLPDSLKEALEQFKRLEGHSAVPLNYRSRLVGLLILNINKPWAKFTQEEKIIFQGLFAQLSVVLENNRLYTEAVTDSLTELYNHKFFQKRLREEIERSLRYHHPLSLLMIDIDNFKLINDRYGHQAGDQALKSVADILKFNMRLVDITARYGGEEFAIILPETPLEGARIAAERLRRVVENSVKVEKTKVTISIGIASCDKLNTALTPEQLIKQADEQLYRAKYEGRNRVCLS